MIYGESIHQPSLREEGRPVKSQIDEFLKKKFVRKGNELGKKKKGRRKIPSWRWGTRAGWVNAAKE